MTEMTVLEAAGTQGMIDVAEAKHIAETLTRHYPGYLWGVNVDMEQGVAIVECVNLPGKWGFYVHLKNLNDDPTHKKIVKAGGELLERFNLSRTRINQNAVDDLTIFSQPEV